MKYKYKETRNIDTDFIRTYRAYILIFDDFYFLNDL